LSKSPETMMTDYAKFPKTHVLGDVTRCRSVSGVWHFRGSQCLHFQGPTGPWHLSWTYSPMNINIRQSCQIKQTIHSTQHHIQNLNPQKQCSEKHKISYSVSFLVSIFGVHMPLFLNFSFINLYHPSHFKSGAITLVQAKCNTEPANYVEIW